MSIIGLTPEQWRLIEQAGGRPLRIEDPETHEAYVLIRADAYERVRVVIEPASANDLHIPEGIRKPQKAICPRCWWIGGCGASMWPTTGMCGLALPTMMNR
jgi:hypothetical protein